jgi:hypothetical protein
MTSTEQWPEPGPSVFAVFAVSAGNYQPSTSPSPQKSWSSCDAAEQRTADNSGRIRCKVLQTGNLAERVTMR